MKICIFSLDYDNCACVLDTETLLGKKSEEGKYKKFKTERGQAIGNYAAIANYYKNFPRAVEQVKQMFEQEIQLHIPEGSSVELYIGSNRQSKSLDDGNAAKNQNGSSFEVLKNYAIQHNMIFRPLLLADVDNGDPTNPTALHLALNRPLAEQLECKFDPLKSRTIIAQLQDAARNHPNNEITFVFFDDDEQNSIIPHLKTQLELAYKDPELKNTLPKKLNLNLCKFDWFPPLENLLKSNNSEKSVERIIAKTTALKFDQTKASLEEKTTPVDELPLARLHVTEEPSTVSQSGLSVFNHKAAGVKVEVEEEILSLDCE